MPMGLGLACECCEEGCAVCSVASDIQATLIGFTQTNTPDERPSPPCACTSINETFLLTGPSGDLPEGECTSGDIAEGGVSCAYTTAGNHCEETVDLLLSSISWSVTVFIFQNASGTVSLFVSVLVAELNEADGLAYTRTYEGEKVLVDTVDVDYATANTVDCSTLDTVVDCVAVCDVSGDPLSDVWCGGTIQVRVEGV